MHKKTNQLSTSQSILGSNDLQKLTWAGGRETLNVILLIQYLTIIPQARVGYEMVDSQRGA